MSLIQRLLSPIVDVRKEEASVLLLMFLYSFLAMTSFNIIKPLTRAQFISDLGAVERPLNSSGRLAIDIPMQRFLVMRVEESEATAEAFASAPLTQFRYYEFVGDEMHITVKGEREATTAVVVYRRRP